MTKSEVAKLFERIVQYYPSFTGDLDKIKAWHEIMHDIPLEVALENLKRHAAAEKFPPTIAELSRSLQAVKTELDRYHDFMREAGRQTLEDFEEMRRRAVAPTPEQRERVLKAYGRTGIH
ncbi:replicative helicase loader/inhibitor [Paenibacillus tarimensis]